MKEVMDSYAFVRSDEHEKIERSLELTNEALGLDDRNPAALNHKIRLLFIKRDTEGLLQTTEKLIEISRGKPYFLGQKALFLALKGEAKEATKYYQQALRKYEDYLRLDSTDFDLNLEYVGLLQTFGDTVVAKMKLEKLEEMGYDDSQMRILEFYNRSDFPNKKRMFDYWNGLITYEQLFENHDNSWRFR